MEGCYQRKATLWYEREESEMKRSLHFPAGGGWVPGEEVRVTRKGRPTSTACSLFLLTCQEPLMACWPGWGCRHFWMDGDHGKQ